MSMRALLFFIILINCLTNAQICSGVVAKDILGNQDVNVDCSYPLTNHNSCLSLLLTYPKFYATDTYKTESITYKPPVPYNYGTPLNVVADDLFVKAVNLPFNFCFFGINYNEIAIGTNGLITFDMSNMDGDAISFPNISHKNPNPQLPTNSVFGVMQDLVFPDNDESEIYYTIEGQAPCRRLIVNFYKGIIAGCQDRSSSQIILYEGTNEIEIYVDEKPNPCFSIKNEKTLIGIQNQDGTLGYSPNNRNTGVWTAQKEAWRFSPAGAEIIPTIQWYNSKKEWVATGANVSVCPDDEEVYTAEASYNICGNANYVLSDDIKVSFDPNFPLVKNYKHIFCTTSTSIFTNLDDDIYKQSLVKRNYQSFRYEFFLTLADAQNNSNPQPYQNIEIKGGEKYFVRISNLSSPTCYRIAELTFNFISSILKKDSVDICDVQADGVENAYVLSKLNGQLFDNFQGLNIKYFLSQSDAQNNVNSVTTARLTAATQLWIRSDVKGCEKVFGPISIVFSSAPIVNTPIDFPVETCDFIGDNLEPYEFFDNLAHLVVSNPNDPNLLIRFYSSLASATSGTGGEVKNIKNKLQKIYVRVEYPGGCYSIAVINLDVTFKPFQADDKIAYICFDGSQDVQFDLDDLSKNMLILPLTGVVKTFYSSKDDAVKGDPLTMISPLQMITEDGNYPSKSFYVRFEDETGCFIVREIKVTLVFPKIFKNSFTVCDVDNDSKEFVSLTKFSVELIGNQNAKVSYFNTQAEALANQNPLTTVEVISSKTVFVRIVAYGCAQVYPISVTLISTPDTVQSYQAVENNVCDNNNDATEILDITKYENSIVKNASLYTFEYYKNYNSANHTFSNLISNPKAFLSTASEVVYVKTIFKSSNCYSATQLALKINFIGAPILKPAVLEICDFDFNFFETFTLSDALPQVFSSVDNASPISNYTISYYETEAEANAGDISKSVNVKQMTKFASVFFWVRFQNKVTNCFSVQSIELKTYFPPKAIISKIKICDNNLDGIMDVNLMDYKNQMVVVASAHNKFSFYYSKSDATQGINRIPNPENFSANPFPARLWVRIENLADCKDVNYIDFETNQSVVLQNAGPFVLNNVCDNGNDGKEIVDLTQFQKRILNHPQASFSYYPTLKDLQQNTNVIKSPTLFAYDVSLHTKPIYVMVSRPGLCPQLTTISIQLKKTPMFTLPDYYFCPGVGIKIEPNWSGLDIKTFEWKNPKGDIISTKNFIDKIKEAGVYQIKVTANNGCSFVTNFNVKAYEVPIITQLIPNGSSYTVVATGSKKILYSLDGIIWQDSNVFNNLPEGVVTFYVKFFGSDCLGEIKKGLVVKVLNAFTPNGDGVNDVWVFDNLNVFEGKLSNIKIHDRSGLEVFEQSSATQLVWSGQHNGRSLSTADYWYVLSLPDGRVFTGWILLKNRN
ncbi:T9SS type B sorting domain-containing protein [Chryseobacterium sp. T1]